MVDKYPYQVYMFSLHPLQTCRGTDHPNTQCKGILRYITLHGIYSHGSVPISWCLRLRGNYLIRRHFLCLRWRCTYLWVDASDWMIHTQIIEQHIPATDVDFRVLQTSIYLWQPQLRCRGGYTSNNIWISLMTLTSIKNPMPWAKLPVFKKIWS